MKDHIDAIVALLEPLGWPVHYVDVPEVPTFPYVLLWGTSGVPSPEQAVTGPDDLTDRVGVTCVAGRPTGVLDVRAAVRGVLDGSRPAVSGRLVWLTLLDSQRTAVDDDTVVPGTNVHPAYGVDLYALTSVPA